MFSKAQKTDFCLRRIKRIRCLSRPKRLELDLGVDGASTAEVGLDQLLAEPL